MLAIMCVRHICVQFDYILTTESKIGVVNMNIMLTALKNKEKILRESFEKYFETSRIQKSGSNLSMLCDTYLDLLNSGGTIPDTVEENISICSQVTEKIRSNVNLRAGLRM